MLSLPVAWRPMVCCFYLSRITSYLYCGLYASSWATTARCSSEPFSNSDSSLSPGFQIRGHSKRNEQGVEAFCHCWSNQWSLLFSIRASLNMLCCWMLAVALNCCQEEHITPMRSAHSGDCVACAPITVVAHPEITGSLLWNSYFFFAEYWKIALRCMWLPSYLLTAPLL